MLPAMYNKKFSFPWILLQFVPKSQMQYILFLFEIHKCRHCQPLVSTTLVSQLDLAKI